MPTGSGVWIGIGIIAAGLIMAGWVLIQIEKEEKNDG